MQNHVKSFESQWYNSMETDNIHRMKKNIEKKITLKSRIVVRMNLLNQVWTAQNDQKKSKDEPVQLVLLLAKIAGVSFNAKLSKLLSSQKTPP